MKHITGQTFDYDSFQYEYDSNPLLQTIVADFDKDGITLNVDSKEDGETADAAPDNSGIEKSAKTAAAKTLNRV